MSYASVLALIFISQLSSRLFIHLGQTQTSWPLILGQAVSCFYWDARSVGALVSRHDLQPLCLSVMSDFVEQVY